MMDTDVADWHEIPPVARVMTNAITCVTLFALGICLARPFYSFMSWRNFPAPTWILCIIYIDSAMFIAASQILTKSFNADHSSNLCDATILICLCFYFVSKVFIYLFFVEKVRLVRNSWIPRLKDKFYIFNIFVVLTSITVIIAFCYVYRMQQINETGRCIIGAHRPIFITLGIGDILVNLYLLALFTRPLTKLDTFKNRHNPAFRTLVVRTFVGSMTSTLTTIVNVFVSVILNGEWYWLCLMLCSLDVLSTALTLHWATAIDSDSEKKRQRSSKRLDRKVASIGPSTTGMTDISKMSVAHPDELPDFAELGITGESSSSSSSSGVSELRKVDEEEERPGFEELWGVVKQDDSLGVVEMGALRKVNWGSIDDHGILAVLPS